MGRTIGVKEKIKNNGLLRYRKNQKYIIFDTETEGLNLKFSRPWQLGYLIVHGDKIVKEEDRWLDWPNLKVGKGAARVTGFSYDEYEKRKEDPLPVLKEFDKYLYNPDYLIIGQNLLGFDVYIHNIYRNLLGFKTDYSYIDRVKDNIAIARAKALGIKKMKSNISEMYKYLHYHDKKIKVSQKALLIELGIDFEEEKLHDAMYDIQKCYEVFKRLIWDIEI